MPVIKSVTNDPINPTKERFAFASAKKIPPYNWIPPTAPPLLETLNQLEFEDGNLPECPDNITENDFESGAGNDDTFTKVPNPSSDFKHDRDELGSGASKTKNEEAFKRLKLAFDFIVCRTRALCLAINDSVPLYNANNPDNPYTKAREAYIEFLQNLDEHHPKEQLGLEDLKKGLGYGKHYRWLFIDPIIKTVKTDNGPQNSITGAVIVMLWNPNSSSSGIPIKHT